VFREVRFPPTSISQGRVRFVRFQEVGRTQQMADMGAKPLILAAGQQCPLAHQHRTYQLQERRSLSGRGPMLGPG